MRIPFFVTLFLTLTFTSVCGARNLNNTSGVLIPFDPSFPKLLRPDVTFMAPLTDSLYAVGKGNAVATFTRNSIATYLGSDGLIHTASANVPRFEANGYLSEGSRVNKVVYSDDLTQAGAWVSTHTNTAYTSSGADGIANHATRLTANGGNSVIAQVVTLASSQVISSCWMRRITGTGAVSISQNNATWTTVTPFIDGVGGRWVRVSTAAETVTNPTFQFMLSTSADAIDVQYCQLEQGAFITSAIPTTTGAVTRQQDAASWAFAGNGGSGTGLVWVDGVQTAFDASSAIAITAGFAHYRGLAIFGNTTLSAWEKAQVKK